MTVVEFVPASAPPSFIDSTTVNVLVDGEHVGRIITHGDERTYQADTVDGQFPDRIGGTIRRHTFSPSESPEEYLTERLGEPELVGYGAYGHGGNISMVVCDRTREMIAERSRLQRGTQ